MGISRQTLLRIDFVESYTHQCPLLQPDISLRHLRGQSIPRKLLARHKARKKNQLRRSNQDNTVAMRKVDPLAHLLRLPAELRIPIFDLVLEPRKPLVLKSPIEGWKWSTLLPDLDDIKGDERYHRGPRTQSGFEGSIQLIEARLEETDHNTYQAAFKEWQQLASTNRVHVQGFGAYGIVTACKETKQESFHRLYADRNFEFHARDVEIVEFLRSIGPEARGLLKSITLSATNFLVRYPRMRDHQYEQMLPDMICNDTGIDQVTFRVTANADASRAAAGLEELSRETYLTRGERKQALAHFRELYNEKWPECDGTCAIASFEKMAAALVSRKIKSIRLAYRHPFPRNERFEDLSVARNLMYLPDLRQLQTLAVTSALIDMGYTLHSDIKHNSRPKSRLPFRFDKRAPLPGTQGIVVLVTWRPDLYPIQDGIIEA